MQQFRTAPTSRGRKNSFKGNFGAKKTEGRNGHSFGDPRNSFFLRPTEKRDQRLVHGGGNSGRNGGSRRQLSEKIDVQRFVKKAENITVENAEKITNTFADFGFCAQILKNLAYKNYITPTPIQDQAMPLIMAGSDLIGLANTGTGKTGAFLLPMIEKVDKNAKERVLIIAPTRELAEQISTEFRQFAWDMQIFSVLCVGGMPIGAQIGNLKRTPSFVIGTPGRLKDLSERGLIKFEEFHNIILDEVDRMLDMGFVDEIRAVLNRMPSDRQSLFFSATLPPKIRELVKQFLHDPKTVQVSMGETARNVDQDIVRVRDKAYKFDQLAELLKGAEFQRVLIFAETKIEVDRLATKLKGAGFKADCIHGDKRQRERQRALLAFKNNQINILVATDVAARGLDIKDISHVINYTTPQTYNDYVHRIGRTGRGDKMGKALTFVG